MLGWLCKHYILTLVMAPIGPPVGPRTSGGRSFPDFLKTKRCW
ncbi:hypothetical protein E2C01_092539 [Portunus trituberculatus]|uniref:Uncharacterized protein n=1 Tax=Portunus trituberculatus TaxID=210409 RepID=A0A5B7JRN0_PORTR|nr:hypothetical protein [Portunus trituberculatus]